MRLPALLALLLVAAPRPARAEDPWLGPDKAAHFGVSAAIASATYALSVPAVERPELRLLTGFGAAVAAGGLKELWDLSGSGTPSWKDFTWDVLGAAVGGLLAYAIDRLFFARPAVSGPVALWR